MCPIARKCLFLLSLLASRARNCNALKTREKERETGLMAEGITRSLNREREKKQQQSIPGRPV